MKVTPRMLRIPRRGDTLLLTAPEHFPTLDNPDDAALLPVGTRVMVDYVDLYHHEQGFQIGVFPLNVEGRQCGGLIFLDQGDRPDGLLPVEFEA